MQQRVNLQQTDLTVSPSAETNFVPQNPAAAIMAMSASLEAEGIWTQSKFSPKVRKNKSLV